MQQTGILEKVTGKQAKPTRYFALLDFRYIHQTAEFNPNLYIYSSLTDQFSVPKWKTLGSQSEILFHDILDVQFFALNL